MPFPNTSPADILFGVLRDIDVASPTCIKDLQDTPEKYELSTSVTLQEALDTAWTTDAYLTSYAIYLQETNTYFDKIVRFKFGPLLEDLRTKFDADVHLRLMCFDWDTPGHEDWTEDIYNEYMEVFQRASEKGCPILKSLSAFYTTRKGCRFICLLDKPILPEEYTSKYLGAVQIFKDYDVIVDHKCHDWQRLFRLPNVVRDGIPTNTEKFFFRSTNSTLLLPGILDPDILPNIASSANTTSSVAVSINVGERPEPADAYSLFKIPGSKGNLILTLWGRRAKKRLVNRECYPCIFEEKNIALPGNRDSVIHTFVGQAVSLLYNIEQSSPEHLYGLFYEPVSRLLPDTDTGDWYQVLWSAVVRCWAKEVEKHKTAEIDEEEDQKKSLELLEIIKDGMSKWCDIPTSSPEDAEDFIVSHSIAVLPGNNFSCITRSGYYDTFICRQNQLIPRIKALGLDKILNLHDPRTLNYKHVNTILNDYGTPANYVEGRAQGKGSVLMHMDQNNSTFIQSLYRRKSPRELKPAFSQDVDSWLRRFFGKHYQIGVNWVAWSLAFEEGPICAISMEGPPSCGKKLFVQGLAECVNTEEYADSTEFGNFQHNLGRSPFIVVNEGFADRNNMPDIADRFRSFISGDPVKLTEKYKAPITIRSPIRIILTANNRDVVSSLIQHRDLGPEDRLAIAIRILHLKLAEDTPAYLNKLGNLKHTKGWIKGDAGSRSDYTVARHFLYLYENRGERTESRFLVEGQVDSDIMTDMSLNAGCSPQVIETLIELIRTLDVEEIATKYKEGFVLLENRIYVTPYIIVKFYRDRLQRHTQIRLTTRQVSRALIGFKSRFQFEHPTRIILDNGTKTAKIRWVNVAPEILQASAGIFGLTSDRLDAICGAGLKTASAEEKLNEMRGRQKEQNGKETEGE